MRLVTLEAHYPRREGRKSESGEHLYCEPALRADLRSRDRSAELAERRGVDGPGRGPAPRHGRQWHLDDGALQPHHPAAPAVDAALVRAINDTLAAAVARHPDRFAAFSALPTADPDYSAGKLRRGVGELGMVGALIHGRTDDQFLSAPRFVPILEAAADLRVPLYLHPGLPPRAVAQWNYDGLPDFASTRLATAA